MTGTEARLRDALAGGAAAVNPSPEALSMIRARIAVRRRRRRRVVLAGAATLATSLAVAAGVVTLRTPPHPPHPPPDAVGPATRPTSVAPGSGGPAASRAPDGTGDAPDARLEHDAMWARLREIPAKQRAVLVLRYYEGLGEAEIADTLGISRGTVKSHSSRGIAALRRLLNEEQAEEEAMSS